MAKKLNTTINALLTAVVSGNYMNFLQTLSIAENDRSFNINARYGIQTNAGLKNGRTLLHLACEYGHLKVVKELIARGADIHKTNSDRMTPLKVAAAKGHFEIVDHIKRYMEAIGESEEAIEKTKEYELTDA